MYTIKKEKRPGGKSKGKAIPGNSEVTGRKMLTFTNIHRNKIRSIYEQGEFLSVPKKRIRFFGIAKHSEIIKKRILFPLLQNKSKLHKL